MLPPNDSSHLGEVLFVCHRWVVDNSNREVQSWSWIWNWADNAIVSRKGPDKDDKDGKDDKDDKDDRSVDGVWEAAEWKSESIAAAYNFYHHNILAMLTKFMVKSIPPCL